MIDRKLIETMFANSRTRNRWDIDGCCLWSYFFTGRHRAKLEQLAIELQPKLYKRQGYLEPTAVDYNQSLFFVRMDRAEQHTVKSLVQRIEELSQFAATIGGCEYDGIEVGPLPA